VDVETSSELTRGYSAMAWDKFARPANAHVIEKVDKKAYFEHLDQLLQIDTEPNLPFKGME
ncbi:hypothetical protein QP158_11550, partial [Streptococcus agalactiae]|nr:hypothetical protein [Streptococcus agalactiae]